MQFTCIHTANIPTIHVCTWQCKHYMHCITSDCKKLGLNHIPLDCNTAYITGITLPWIALKWHVARFCYIKIAVVVTYMHTCNISMYFCKVEYTASQLHYMHHTLISYETAFTYSTCLPKITWSDAAFGMGPILWSILICVCVIPSGNIHVICQSPLRVPVERCTVYPRFRQLWLGTLEISAAHWYYGYPL